MREAAVGFRAHSGWAVAVALADPAAPVVVHRTVLKLAERPQGVQPYHAAVKMRLKEAAEFIDRCAKVTDALARQAVREWIEDLRGYRVIGGVILEGSGRETPDLAATLASHALIHTAEGEFYRRALRRACEACGVAVSGVKEKELAGLAAPRLGIPADALMRRAADLGKGLGPPLRRDEKLAALAAWLRLATAARP